MSYGSSPDSETLLLMMKDTRFIKGIQPWKQLPIGQTITVTGPVSLPAIKSKTSPRLNHLFHSLLKLGSPRIQYQIHFEDLVSSYANLFVLHKGKFILYDYTLSLYEVLVLESVYQNKLLIMLKK
jgi:hypothetical protein